MAANIRAIPSGTQMGITTVTTSNNSAGISFSTTFLATNFVAFGYRADTYTGTFNSHTDPILSLVFKLGYTYQYQLLGSTGKIKVRFFGKGEDIQSTYWPTVNITSSAITLQNVEKENLFTFLSSQSSSYSVKWTCIYWV